jgi:hypothetical protein
MRAALQQNTLFGMAKSALAYVFIVVLYRLASGDLIQDYITYEIALGLSILATAGMQSQSYKEMDARGLHVLSLAGLLLLALLIPLRPWLGDRAWLMALLVVLDRLADLQLQGTRQDGHFLRYNLLDFGSQTITKGGFLLEALGWHVWPWLLACKAVGSTAWLVLRRLNWKTDGFWVHPRSLFASGAEWGHYLSFDALNYATGQLDLLLLTRLAPAPTLAAYFYIRKFVRLPLVLLNYALDPAYVHLKAIMDSARRRQIIARLLTPAALGMVGFAGILVPLSAWSSRDPLIARAAMILAGTSVFWVLQRFLDVESLLNWSQGRRTASRLAGAVANVAPALLPLVGVDWLIALALIPWLAWTINLVWIVRSHEARQYILLAVALTVSILPAWRPLPVLSPGGWLGWADGLLLAGGVIVLAAVTAWAVKPVTNVETGVGRGYA